MGGGFRQLGRDIRYLKSDIADATLTFLVKIAHLLWLNYLFIALLVLSGVFALLDKQTLAGRRSLAKTRQLLKNANTEEQVSEALTAYIQVRYGVHTASLPLRNISAALEKHGCPADLVKHFEALWQRLNAARFAPLFSADRL